MREKSLSGIVADVLDCDIIASEFKLHSRYYDHFRTNFSFSDFYRETDIFMILSKAVKLATVVEGDPKAPFSIATTPRCRGGHYSFPWIAPLPYN